VRSDARDGSDNTGAVVSERFDARDGSDSTGAVVSVRSDARNGSDNTGAAVSVRSDARNGSDNTGAGGSVRSDARNGSQPAADRLPGLDLEAIVAVPMPAGPTRRPCGEQVPDREGHAEPAPLAHVLELVGELRGAQRSPCQDLAAEGDRQPVAQEDRSGAAQPGPHVDPMRRGLSHASWPRRAADRADRPSA
jgi:hypothetical protein